MTTTIRYAALTLLATGLLRAADVSGVVFSATTGEPIPGAVLTLRASEGRPSAAATGTSGPDGTFRLPQVEAGRYLAAVRKAGYHQTPFSDYIAVNEGAEKLEGVRIRVWPEGSVNGHVLDAEGEPVAEAEVRAFAVIYGHDGPRIETAAKSDSNEDGEYRLFGLTAGKYLLHVSPPGVDSSAGAYYRDTPGTFYPSTSSPARAVAVRVEWGQDLRGTDLRFVGEPGFAIVGTVWDSEVGRPCIGCNIQALQIDGGMRAPLPTSTRTDANGAYMLRGLASGDYRVIARRGGKDAAAATRDVAIRGRHVEDAHLAVGIRQPVAGMIDLSDSPDETTIDGWTPVLTPISAPSWWTVSRGGFADDGTFEMDDLAPGDYRFSIQGLPGQTYLAGLESGGRVGPPFVSVPQDAATTALRPVVAFDAAVIRGRVEAQGDSQSGIAGAQVVLVPQGEAGGARTALFARPAADGSFEIVSIPPGQYAAYAIPAGTESILFDPADGQRLRGYGRRLSLRPNAAVTVELRLAPGLEAVY